MTEKKQRKILDKKIKKISKYEKKVQQGREYIESNKVVSIIHLIITCVLFVWAAILIALDGDINAGWFALECINCIICVYSIAMLHGYPLLVFWKFGKKVNDVLDGVEFLSGIALIAIKIPCIVVLLIAYVIYGFSIVIPGVYFIISCKASKDYEKKLNEIEEECKKLKEEVANNNILD